MNKAEFIKQISEELDITQTDTEKLYDTLVEIMSSNLENDTGFTIPGLGSFNSKIRDEYQSYNPHYKTMVVIPKKKIVQFTPSSSIKDELKGGGL